MEPMGERDRILVRVDPDLIDLIPVFLQNRRRDAIAIKGALARGDMERIRVIGHSMKGSGSGYGFPTLSEVGAVIEHGAQRLNHEAILDAVAQLEEYLARIEVAYD